MGAEPMAQLFQFRAPCEVIVNAVPSVPLPCGYGNGSARVLAMGCAMLPALTRDVRARLVAEEHAEAGAGAGPHGHQAFIRFAARRRLIFRQRTQDAIRSPRNRAHAEPRRTRLLSGAELRTLPVDARGGN